MSEHPDNHDPFYVGYLPMPAQHARFVHLLTAILALWILGVAGIIAFTMRDPGDAVWITSNEQSWTGTLAMHPYPMLIPNEDPQRPLLVVSMGKRGAHDRLAPFDGAAVTLRGWELLRDDRRLIELAEDEGAIAPASGSPTAFSDPSPAGVMVTLEGEIVDGKCYLGAMKPGDGAGHQACAILCLRGKLPPMFATVDADGEAVYHLLVIDGVSEISEETIPLVARRVRIVGRLSHPFGGLSVLSTTEHSILQKD